MYATIESEIYLYILQRLKQAFSGGEGGPLAVDEESIKDILLIRVGDKKTVA